ncbi:MAG: carboxymuconolactone decarboxylase family protein [Pseudorhodoferax sp.]
MTSALRQAPSRARIAPAEHLAADAGGELADLERFVGYRPHALATMARRPGLLGAVLQLVNTALRQDGHLPEALRYLLACEAARQAGCRYTATHLAHAAHRVGVTWERIGLLASPADAPACFDGAERALLALARPLGTAQEKDAVWHAAGAHWSSDALAEAVGVIALAAWFSRWNTLVETELEDEPASAIDHVSWLGPAPL